MARRSEHSRDEIKSMILEAAENIVREQGFSALKIRQISADMGYTVASVYMVFANMDDLNTQIKIRTVEKILAAISVEEECLAIALAYFDFVSQERGLSRMLLQHQALKKSSSEKVYSDVQKELQSCFCASLKSMNTGHTMQEIKDASSVVVNAVQGNCLPLLMQESSNQESIRNNIKLLLTCFLRGWRKQ